MTSPGGEGRRRTPPSGVESVRWTPILQTRDTHDAPVQRAGRPNGPAAHDPAPNGQGAHEGASRSGAGRFSFPVALVAVAVAYCLLYAGTFGRLADVWWSRDDFSHGFLIPVISAYLVWLKRSRLAALGWRPAMGWGLAVVVVSGALRVIGGAAGVIAVEGLSAVMMLAGLVLLTAGPVVARAVAFPLAYLVFMVPVFDGLVTLTQWPFQLMTAQMGVALLQSLGYTVLLDRQFIVLPSIRLEVARVCSGVNYLVAILAIGLPVAYVVLGRWWTRTALVLSALAIGVVANWARVAFIGMWAYAGGEVLHGPFHVFQGLVVAWVGFGALFAGAWGLSVLERRFGPLPHRQEARPVAATGNQGARASDRRAWVVAVVVLVAFWLMTLAATPLPGMLTRPLTTLPTVLGEWRGTPASPDLAPFRLQSADEELVRVYRRVDGEEATVYIGYLRTGGSGKEVVNYLTAPLHAGTAPLPISLSANETLVINHGEWASDRARYRLWFWYEIGGRVISGRYAAKAETLKNALLHDRGDEVLVLVTQRAEGTTGTRASPLEIDSLVRGVLTESRALFAPEP